MANSVYQPNQSGSITSSIFDGYSVDTPLITTEVFPNINSATYIGTGYIPDINTNQDDLFWDKQTRRPMKSGPKVSPVIAEFVNGGIQE